MMNRIIFTSGLVFFLLGITMGVWSIVDNLSGKDSATGAIGALLSVLAGISCLLAYLWRKRGQANTGDGRVNL